jgi:uncharacterized RDD family membrane protein YckC
MNATFFCNRCGAQNAPEAQFCARCGTPTTLTPGTVAPAVPPVVGPSPFQQTTAYGAPSFPGMVPVVAVGYGGFWIRVVAAIIDTILLRILVSPVHLFFGGLGMAGMLGGLHHPRGLAILGGGTTVIATVFASWLYEAFMESSSYQATLGKMIFGMKVTDLGGNRISFERATGRHFAKWISGLILGIGYIMVAFSERKQGLHDLLAGTLVLRS